MYSCSFIIRYYLDVDSLSINIINMLTIKITENNMILNELAIGDGDGK
tara:strand:- start:461 stop:604 length:144 start_codon:yes stop_codon:yes gene_type:complete